jgi:homocysteine S-methyltransferase
MSVPGCGPAWLDRRIARGETVLIDGATGTELQARGVPMRRYGWGALAQLEHPDVLRGIHEDYIRAGADVIITNTFAAGRHMLEPGGLGERVAEINRRAVEIAREAREIADRPIAIAGSISNYLADDRDPRWLARLPDTYAEQVGILTEAGVDLIACEMMERPDLAVPAVRAACASGLPVWLGLCGKRAAEGARLNTFDYPEHSFEETLDAVIELPVGLVCVMHTSINDTPDALVLVRERWSGPLGAYPESGYFTEPEWQFVDVIEPDDFGEIAARWAREGMQVIGGCCGLGVDHIRALAERLPASPGR